MYLRTPLLILLSLITPLLLSAESMFTLTGVTKVYPVVEVSGKRLPTQTKALITELLLETTEELDIDTKGYDQRSLAVLVNELPVGRETLINIRLLIGEQVMRMDQKEKCFAITYDSIEHILYRPGVDMEERIEDAMDTLLSKFAEQYREENIAFEKIAVGDASLAKVLHYETDYEVALKRAKKEHKDIMLVLVANFCPWCRKFEERVLLKKEVDTLIQEHYIPLIINKEKGGFPKELDRGFTPIVHFISYKTAKSYKSVVGYNNRDSFIYLLRSASTHQNTTVAH